MRQLPCVVFGRRLTLHFQTADTVMKVGQSFHSSGFTANYVEVGGPDSVSNVQKSLLLSVLIVPLMLDCAFLHHHNRGS